MQLESKLIFFRTQCRTYCRQRKEKRGCFLLLFTFWFICCYKIAQLSEFKRVLKIVRSAKFGSKRGQDRMTIKVRCLKKYFPVKGRFLSNNLSICEIGRINTKRLNVPNTCIGIKVYLLLTCSHFLSSVRQLFYKICYVNLTVHRSFHRIQVLLKIMIARIFK